MKYLFLGMSVLLITLLLTGCVPGDGTFDTQNLAGFWWGLWHGIILIFSFIYSLFSDNVTIYEVHNSGVWYNFGFVLGTTMSIGGGSSATRRPK
jgi:hypothetical protein